MLLSISRITDSQKQSTINDKKTNFWWFDVCYKILINSETLCNFFEGFPKKKKNCTIVVANVCGGCPTCFGSTAWSISVGGRPAWTTKVDYRMKKDVFWVVIGRGWSRDYTWVILIGLQMCVGMPHMGCHFKNTTGFEQKKSCSSPKWSTV